MAETLYGIRGYDPCAPGPSRTGDKPCLPALIGPPVMPIPLWQGLLIFFSAKDLGGTGISVR